MRKKQTDQTLEITNNGHHFSVEIPASKDGSVVITEHYASYDLVPDDSIKHVRAILPKALWTEVASTLRHEYNAQCQRQGFSRGKWLAGHNVLPAHFGKELTVLAWAIEQVDETLIPTAIQNWLGLTQEERWWLYTQANAATGHYIDGRGKGWRKAIQIALTENPLVRAS